MEKYVTVKSQIKMWNRAPNAAEYAHRTRGAGAVGGLQVVNLDQN